MKNNCKGKSWQRDHFPYFQYPCSRKEWKDGYCKTHHPEEKRKRNTERENAKEKQYQDAKALIKETTDIDGNSIDGYEEAKTKEQKINALKNHLSYLEQRTLDVTRDIRNRIFELEK